MSGTTLVERYLSLCASGRTSPDLTGFVRTHPYITSHELVDVLLVDQRYRWRGGERPPVEQYLRDFPCVAERTERLVDLVYGEILLTIESGGDAELEGFAARFPGIRDELARRMELVDWLRDDTAGVPATEWSADGSRGARGAETASVGHGPTSRGVLMSDRSRTRLDGRPQSLHGPVAGDEVVPGYTVRSELGRGGMGVVYKALDLRLNRLVALKTIRDGPHAAPEHRARFRIEAEAVARLRHPHIVQIYQIGECDGLPFVAFELLDGGTLAQRLSDTLPAWHEAAALLATLADAVHAAHRAGIVHRDLKPSNVLFDGEGQPKVADFGLAKRLEVEEGATLTGQLLGTPSYMAPEQAAGRAREVGPAADVYALGAVFYEMLTGRPPFKGTTAAETLRLVQTEEPVPPSRLRRGLPRDVETICLKCLEKEPRQRYGDASELAADLNRFLKGQPVRARRTPLWERGAKWARRHPAASVVLAAALAAAAALAGLSVRADFEARTRARREAVRVGRLRAEVDQTILSANGALAQGRWDDALELTLQELTRVEKERLLVDRKTTLNRLLEQARRGSDERKSHDADRARLQRFADARDEALFLDTRFTGHDTPARLEATGRAARAGLAVFGSTGPGGGDDWLLDPLPPSLTERERADVEEEFYELLLVLADATAPTSTGGPGAALAILDAAARRRPEGTRAYSLRRAAFLRDRGDVAAADREDALAARRAPTGGFDFFLSGREHFRRREWSAAVHDLEAALQAEPGRFWAQCLLAISHLQIRQPARARPSLNACIQRRPDLAWLFLLRGLAYAQSGELASGAEATAQFEAAEEDYRTALRLLEARQDDPEVHYALLVNRGLIRLQRHDDAAAAADLNEATRLDGSQYLAFSALGEVYRRQGRHDEALAQYDRAVRLRPGFAPLYRARAGVVLDLDDPTPARRAAAVRDLDEAIRCEPRGSTLVAGDQTRRARLLLQAGRAAEALASCEAALALNPRDADTHRLRVRALLTLKRYDDLAPACDAALAAGPRSADLYEVRGLARYRAGDYAGAIADDTLALELQPDSRRVLDRRGWSYLFTGAPALAARDFEAVLRADPADVDAHLGRGLARARLGQYREAARDAEAARGPKPSSWRTLYFAARVYAAASVAARSDTGREGRAAAALANRYEDLAVELARQTFDVLPPGRRPSAWARALLADKGLDPVHRRLMRTLPVPPADDGAAPEPTPDGPVKDN